MKSGSQRKQGTARRAAQMQPAALRQARKTSPHPSPLDASPRLAAERQRLDGAFGPAIQRQPEEEERQRKVAPVQRQDAADRDELQKKAAPGPVQREPNGSAGTTGSLPGGLKAGIESLSGLDMSGVQVHRNSAEPAKIGALAYAQGKDIHLGPGQDKHLPHEAWHLVQQRQGRVRPTMQAKGVAINDDPSLEREADAMGARALYESSRAAHVSDRKESGSLEGSLGSPSTITAPAQRLPANVPQAIQGEVAARLGNLGDECQGSMPLAAAFADFARHVTSPRTRRVRNGGREITRLRHEIQAARNMRAQQALANLTNYLQQHNLI